MPHSPANDRTRTYAWSDPKIAAAAARKMSGQEYLAAVMRGTLPAGPIMETLGFRLVEVGDGRAVFACDPGEFVYNAIGSVHGGLAATLIDSAASCAVHTQLPAGTGYTTINLAVDYIKGISDSVSELHCAGRVVRAGGRIGVADAELIGPDGTLYARGSATCLILRPEKA